MDGMALAKVPVDMEGKAASSAPPATVMNLDGVSQSNRSRKGRSGRLGGLVGRMTKPLTGFTRRWPKSTRHEPDDVASRQVANTATSENSESEPRDIPVNLLAFLAFLVGGALAIGALNFFAVSALSGQSLLIIMAYFVGGAFAVGLSITIGGVLLARLKNQSKEEDCSCGSGPDLYVNLLACLAFTLGGGLAVGAINMNLFGLSLGSTGTAYILKALMIVGFFMTGTLAIGLVVSLGIVAVLGVKSLFTRSPASEPKTKPQVPVNHEDNSFRGNLIALLTFAVGGALAVGALNLNLVSSTEGSFDSEYYYFTMLGYLIGGAFAAGLIIALGGVVISKFFAPKPTECCAASNSHASALGFLAFSIGGGLAVTAINKNILGESVATAITSIIYKTLTYTGYFAGATLALGTGVFLILALVSGVKSLFVSCFTLRPKATKPKKAKASAFNSADLVNLYAFLIFFLGGALALGVRYLMATTEASDYVFFMTALSYSWYYLSRFWVFGVVLLLVVIMLASRPPKMSKEEDTLNPLKDTESHSTQHISIFGLLVFLVGGGMVVSLFGASTSADTFVPRTGLQVLLPGESMNVSQYLTTNCTEGTDSCNPQVVFLTNDCNFVISEGSEYTGQESYSWQSKTSQRCDGGLCESCAVSIDDTTGTLVLRNDEKKLWTSRTPKKVSSINGNFSVSFSDNGVLHMKKGEQKVVTIGHALKTTV